MIGALLNERISQSLRLIVIDKLHVRVQHLLSAYPRITTIRRIPKRGLRDDLCERRAATTPCLGMPP